MMARPYFTKAQWFALPLKMRQEWWDATDYGRKEAPTALKLGCLAWLVRWGHA